MEPNSNKLNGVGLAVLLTCALSARSGEPLFEEIL